MKFKSSSDTPFSVRYNKYGEMEERWFTKINHAIRYANCLDEQGRKNIGIHVEGIGFTFMAFNCYVSPNDRLWVRVKTVRNIIMRADLLQCQQTSACSSTIKTPTAKT
jgi:hypothetical protein